MLTGREYDSGVSRIVCFVDSRKGFVDDVVDYMLGVKKCKDDVVECMKQIILRSWKPKSNRMKAIDKANAYGNEHRMEHLLRTFVRKYISDFSIIHKTKNAKLGKLDNILCQSILAVLKIWLENKRTGGDFLLFHDNVMHNLSYSSVMLTDESRRKASFLIREYLYWQPPKYDLSIVKGIIYELNCILNTVDVWSGEH